jgi:predicted nucleic acid-binding protein
MADATKRSAERQYWDSCLFIDFIADRTATGSARSKLFIALVSEARAGRSLVLLSNAVLAEIRPKKARNGTHRKILEDLLEVNRPFVQFFGLTRKIALRARDEGAKHSLSVIDSIHIATAIEGNADVLFTYDGYKPGSAPTKSLALNGQFGRLKIEIPRVNIGPLLARP